MKKTYYLALGVSLMGGLLLSCSSENTNSGESVQALNLANMDTTIRPQDDFFGFVNGDWIAKTEIPGDQGRWGSFNELREFNNQAVLDVLEKAMNDDQLSPDSDQGKAVAFYKIGMDSLLAEKRGVEPLVPTFERIDNIEDVPTLQEYLVFQQQHGGGAFFGTEVSTDLKDSNKMALYISQGGLGLPDRDYYTEDTEKFKEIREKYLQHLSNTFKLIGFADEKAEAASKSVMALETRLAQASKTKVELRDPEGRYNKFTISELKDISPSLDWELYFTSLGAKVDEVIVSTPKFMEEVEQVLQEASLDTWRNYLKWHAIEAASPYLSYKFVKNNFDFFGRELQGTDQIRPRWKRVLASTENAVGEAVGKLYTEEYFPQEAKDKAKEMVDNILLAMGERIKRLDWMSEETKAKALEKLGTFHVKIGFPDKWKDYSSLAVNGNPENASYFENVQAASSFRFRENLEKLGKPIDKEEWFMTPQTVNAYYNPTWNEIVFPAGILQSPFYNYKADAAVNYGGIGAVIGHEISHGFDDQGSQYDAEGNLKNWWQENDRANFKARTGKLVAQFDSYEPIEGVKVNGELTLGENIGDLGGMLVAYDGLQRYFQKHKRPENIDGFTPEQRFFISWATIWRMKSREEALRTQIQTDPHSPAQYRGNGPLVNIDAFYEAFEVKEGDKMYKAPDDRVRIW